MPFAVYCCGCYWPLLYQKQPKLHRDLAVISAIGLTNRRVSLAQLFQLGLREKAQIRTGLNTESTAQCQTSPNIPVVTLFSMKPKDKRPASTTMLHRSVPLQVCLHAITNIRLSSGGNVFQCCHLCVCNEQSCRGFEGCSLLFSYEVYSCTNLISALKVILF